MIFSTRPTLIIKAPRAGQHVSNSLFSATGTAKDNVAVASVVYRLNNGPWTNATGTASWFRAFKSDGTSPVFDGTVGVTGGGFDLEMPTTSIVQHAEVTVSSLTYTASEG